MTNIILCGGSGTRLWPLSRTLLPKQFVKMVNGQSLFSLALGRCAKAEPSSKNIIICNENHYFLALDECEGKDASFVLEPFGRNTAAAIAYGASYKGKKIGSVADFTSFSFHAVKNFTTAEGGAALWNSIDGIADEDIYKEYQLLSLHGQNKDALAKTKLGAWEYDIKGTYFKCNMTDILAAIGLIQMKRYPGMLARRREIISRYDAGLQDLPVEVLAHYTEEHVSSGHLYLVRLIGRDAQKRDGLSRCLAPCP